MNMQSCIHAAGHFGRGNKLKGINKQSLSESFQKGRILTINLTDFKIDHKNLPGRARLQHIDNRRRMFLQQVLSVVTGMPHSIYV